MDRFSLQSWASTVSLQSLSQCKNSNDTDTEWHPLCSGQPAGGDPSIIGSVISIWYNSPRYPAAEALSWPWLGISEPALKWLCSYLHGRKQTVLTGDSTSPPEELHTGMPRGSVLGPQLFLVYSAPLSRVIRKHGLDKHFYADDTQLYFATKPTQDNVAELLEWIAQCIAEICQWMRANFLKLNDDKAEIMLFGSFYQLKVTIDSISIGEVSINLSSTVRNLGILLDSSMSIVTHISSICSSAHFHLQNIARIRPFPSEKATEQLVHAFITSKPDMGNSLLFGLPEYQITRLQKIQNHAARLVTKTPCNMHITPALKHLHWLPIRQSSETNFFSMSTVHFPVKDRATCLT